MSVSREYRAIVREAGKAAPAAVLLRRRPCRGLLGLLLLTCP
jgi:hypothetical protein